MVLAARVTDRVGKGLRGPPRDAIIADDTTASSRGRAFGFHRAADTAGAVVGPLLGLALYEAFDHEFQPLLWIALIPAAGPWTRASIRITPAPSGTKRRWIVRRGSLVARVAP